MFTKATFAALAVALTASMATASTAPVLSMDAPQAATFESYETADTRGMDNRQDRRGDRQGCRDANRLMTTPFVASDKYLSDLSSDLNLNGNQLRADMNSASVLLELENSASLSRLFAFVGTPAMVIGRTVVQGRVSSRTFQKIVNLERKEGWAEACG